VNKTAPNATQLINSILLHAYLRTSTVPNCSNTNINFI